MRAKMPLGLELQNRNQILSVHDGFVLVAFVQTEPAFVGSLRQIGNAILNLLGHTQIHYAPCGFRVKTLAERV